MPYSEPLLYEMALEMIGDSYARRPPLASATLAMSTIFVCSLSFKLPPNSSPHTKFFRC
jgi:hypothetical protein